MVYVIDVVRSAVGKYGGSLSQIRPDDLLAHVIRALMLRNPSLDPNAIEDLIAGDANQAGEDTRNVARMAALLAGLPVSVPGNTVNRLCASGLQAIMDASRGILCGEGMVYLAGGVESMSRAPYVLSREVVARKTQQLVSGSGAGTQGEIDAEPTGEAAERPFDEIREADLIDSTIGWRFANPALTKKYYPWSMGETAENVARQFGVGRRQQDEYALRSHEKYFEAAAVGKFDEEIIGIEVADHNGNKRIFNRDEYPRKTSMQVLSALKPAFAPGGTVTAGNSSGLNDGAAAMLLANDEALSKFGFHPIAKVVSMAVSGIDPSIMGLGPIEATNKALQRAGLTIADIGLVELNESFAAQSIACITQLGFDPAMVNVNGGSLAIGHPLGCSGVRISATLIHEMKRRKVKYGLATMCAGMGQGAAVIYEGMT